jgi:1,4-dihydroxy-2-naphthoate octaprenyltransferase
MLSPGKENSGPSAAQYAGDRPGQVIRRLFHATRPKFFPASVLPVVAGTAWGVAAGGSFDAPVFVLALFATSCVHAGANVLNDVGDDAGGTDRINEGRIYPYTGGSRFIQEGILSAASMARLGITLLVAAAIAGFLLLMLKGSTVLWFGLAGVALAVLYSLGPVRLSSLGLGELAVGIAFGVLPVCGAAWLQSGVLDLPTLLYALPISAWVANILLINEVPDIEADGATGKRTLPVRLGLNGTAVVYLVTAIAAASVTVWLSLSNGLPLLAPLVPLALLVLADRAARSIRRGPDDRAAMTAGIEATLAIHTIGSLWLAACALYLALFVQA